MDSDNSDEGGNTNLAFSLGFSFVLLLALVIISYFSYKCTRSWGSPPHQSTTSTSSHAVAGGGVGAGAGGLVESDLVNYPKFTLSQAKSVKVGDVSMVSGNSGCSICLADYKDSDMLRLLPECGHYFHLRCIDPWLKLHPTCPLCRSSPMPTPLAPVVSVTVDHPH